MVHFFMPWDSGKQIGKSYNKSMALLRTPGDWACFTDADTMFTTNDYGLQIEEIIRANPDKRAFTAYTNRIGSPWQVAPGSNSISDDISEHRGFGKQIQENSRCKVIDVTDQPPMSGFLILLRNDLWVELGGFKETGMLGVDTDFHRKIKSQKKKLYLMTGVYLYHWYRGGTGDKSHLIE